MLRIAALVSTLSLFFSVNACAEIDRAGFLEVSLELQEPFLVAGSEISGTLLLKNNSDDNICLYGGHDMHTVRLLTVDKKAEADFDDVHDQFSVESDNVTPRYTKVPSKGSQLITAFSNFEEVDRLFFVSGIYYRDAKVVETLLPAVSLFLYFCEGSAPSNVNDYFEITVFGSNPVTLRK